MPEASSATVMEDAGLAGAPVGGFAFADEEAAAGGHDVERVADEVGDDLADFAVEAVNFAAGAAAALDADAGVVDAALIDGEDAYPRGRGGS